MALSLLSPPLSPFSHSFKNTCTVANSHCMLLSSFSPFTSSPTPVLRAYCTSKDGVTSEKPSIRSLDDDLLRRLSGAKDADQVLDVITESGGSNGVKMTTSDCNSLIAAAFERGNADLPLSLFDAMRLGISPGLNFGAFSKTFGTNSGLNMPCLTNFMKLDDGLDGNVVSDTWRWPRPDIHTYALLVQGLATSLRVNDAISIIGYVSGMGISSEDEVLFGLVIQCPACKVAIAVAQPQNGTQIASCSKCRYQYELFSGDIVSIESEEIRISPCRTQRGHLWLGKGFDFSQS